jgi:predicted enzyme related to lactoylglutathione lyase
MSAHPIVHIELSAKDAKSAAKFYATVFEWKVEAFQGGDYLTFEAKPGPGGGFNIIDNDHKAGEIIPYIQVEDIDAMLAKVGANGGTTLQGKTPIPGEGHFALFEDPSGNRLGLFSG